MSLRQRLISFSAIILMTTALAVNTQAQTREPSSGRMTTPLAEPADTRVAAPTAAARLWERIALWSSKRSSESRWRNLYSRPASPARASR